MKRFLFLPIALCAYWAAAQQPAKIPPAQGAQAGASPQTETIPSPQPAPANQPVNAPGYMDRAQVEILVHKIGAMDLRIEDLLKAAHPEKWIVSNIIRNSLTQTLENLHTAMNALEAWRSEFEKRPDSIYYGFQTYAAINATLRSVVPGRRLDDDCNAFLRMSNGAAGTLACSQVAAGEMNEVHLRIFGEKGSLAWRQQDPNRLIVKWLDRPEEIHHAAMNYLSTDARAVARVPAGHPEGYLEAFAVLYREFADVLVAWKQGQASPLPATLPGIEAGVRGMRFIARAIESDRREGWMDF